MLADTYKIALAALLHDIGKVMQRTGRKHKDSLLRQKSIFCKYDNCNNRYIYLHSLYTVQFIEDYLNYILDEKYLKISAKHHVPETEMENIIAKADKLSAGMDRRAYADEDFKKYDFKSARLYSIFQNIKNINPEKDYKPSNYYYDLIPLEISERIFPQKDGEAVRDTASSENEYERLFEEMEEEIRNIDRNKSIEYIYNTIHSILEKYTSFVPSSTIDYPDISLFDHLRTTSAIAVCLCEVFKSEEKPKKEFLLLEADVSGIQNFIYKITEGEETKKNIAKSLRGRSAYVNILIDFMSKYMVRELGLTISNILYCGGGKFQLLLPNTSKTKEKLEKIVQEIEGYLYREYKAKIGLVIDYIEIDEEGITDYATSITRLHDKMQEAKNRKFINIINMEKDNFFIKTKRPKKVCKYCHVNEEEQDGACKGCRKHIELGEKLVEGRIKYVVYDFKGNINAEKADVTVEFGDLGKVHFFKSLSKPVDAFLIENINGSGQFGRIKFVGNVVPKFKDNKYSIVSFNDIAELSEGDNKIAVLKMDIDNLGTIFSSGLDEKNRSISRISTLSRLIDLFFSGYMNRLCKKLYEDYGDKDKVNLDELFYINYSGGDDLLIIGPWDWTLKLALEIRKELDRYVCNNPNITVSAGVYICNSKTPIRISSEEAEVYLEKAKEKEGKNSVCVFERAIDWFKKDSLDKAFKDSDEYKKWLEDKKVSKGLIYNIMIASKNISLKSVRPEDFDLIPRIAYFIARNVKDEEVRKKLSRKLITAKIEDSEIEFIKFPLMITLMKTRTVEEG